MSERIRGGVNVPFATPCRLSRAGSTAVESEPMEARSTANLRQGRGDTFERVIQSGLATLLQPSGRPKPAGAAEGKLEPANDLPRPGGSPAAPGKLPAEWPPGSGQAFTPPVLYVNERPDGGFDVVDASGKPLPSPPLLRLFTESGKPGQPAYYVDPWGNKVESLYPPGHDLLKPDGTLAGSPGTPPPEWPS
jgi:hypothetical protein